MKEIFEGLGKWLMNMVIFIIGLSIDSKMGNFKSGFPIFTIIALIFAGIILIKHLKTKDAIWWLLAIIGIKLLVQLM